MNVIRKEETYTIEDIYALPEGERAELIDGKIYYMAPPNTKHQRLVSDLHYQIKDFINMMMEYPCGEEIPVGIFEGFFVKVQ